MNEFLILPAVDIKDGRCVRLKQGLADEVTVYGEDPVRMAMHWESEGGRYLHVVDLDGAFQGHPVHTEIIARIVEALSIPVEVGGGLRTDTDVSRLLDLGVDRVVLGTRAWSDRDGLAHLVKRFGAHLAVGIDARDGRVQVKGWTETTGESAVDLARAIDALGIGTLIYTDTSRDGMLEGVNTEAVQRICEAVSCSVIASGGVSRPGDIGRLRALGMENLGGAIVGKALYDKKVSLQELQQE